MIARATRRRLSRLAIAAAAGLSATAVTATAAGYALGLRLNTTESMPRGIYHLTPVQSLARGDIVWVCPPNTETFRTARRHGYVPEGFCRDGFTPILKPVAALPGDTVQVDAHGVHVNGRLLPNTAPASRDAHGNRLPRVPARPMTVQPGQVWLASTHHPGSFDSRYFGPVPLANVEAKARPLYTGGI